MMFQVGLFAVGLLILLTAAQLFVQAAEKLAVAFRFSPLIIGLTVVAVGTSVPELSISLIAGARGDFGLAFGNIIGSNIVNILLVLAVAILMGELRVGTVKTPRNALLLGGLTALFALAVIIGLAPRVTAVLLLGMAVFITVYEAWLGVHGRRLEDAVRLRRQKRQRLTGLDWLALSGSVGAIVLGAFITVSATEAISGLTGITTTVLGLSLTAVATSLPELFIAVISQRAHNEKMALGNIIGSNIYNLTLIGGLLLFFYPPVRLPASDVVVMLAATALLVGIVMGNRGRSIPRSVGFGLIGLVMVYFYVLPTFFNR